MKYRLIATLLPLLLTNWTHGVPSQFNGGRMQIGQNFLTFSGEFFYLNSLKTGTAWAWLNNAVGSPGPDMLDVNGYPVFQTTYLGNACGSGGICNTGIRMTTEIPCSAERSYSYVIVSTGTGTVRASGSGLVSVSGTDTQTAFTANPSVATSGQCILNVDITATSSVTPITKMAVVHADDTVGSDLTNYLTRPGTAVGTFGAKMLARLLQLKPGVDRYMNIQLTNLSNVTRWEERTPIDYIAYGGYTYKSAYYAASNPSGTNDYPVTLGSGGPTDKQMLHILFQGTAPATTKTVTTTSSNCSLAVTAHGYSVNDPVGFYGASGGNAGAAAPLYAGANYYVVSVLDADHITVAGTIGGTCIAPTQSNATTRVIRQPTLDLNGSGRIAIKNYFSNTLNSTSNIEVPQNNRIGTLVYDDDLKIWMLQGGSSGDGLFDQGIVSGFPVEHGILLAAYIGAHPWYVQPPLTAFPSVGSTYSNWLPSLAAYVKANAPSWMIPRFELVGNEIWNLQFPGSAVATNKASFYYGTLTAPNLNDWNNGYGYAASLAGQAVNAVYGGSVPRDNSRYWTVIGVQQVSSPGSNDARLASTKFLSTGPAPPAGYTTSAAYNWVTHAAPANYYAPGMNAATMVSTMYRYGAGDASQVAIYVAAAAVSNPPALGPIPTKVASFLDHYNWGMGLGAYTGKPWTLAGITIGQTPYEGGWSVAYPTSADISSSTSNSTSPVTSVSKAANAVLALTTTTNPNTSGPTTGNGAVVGMPIRIVNAAGGDFTRLNGARQTITFTNSSADITLNSNGFVVGQSAAFTTASTSDVLPSNLAKTTVYCVTAAATNTFQVAAVCGDPSIVINTSGATGTQQVTTGWYVTGVGGGLGANNVSINADSSAYTGAYTASSASLVYMSDNYNTRNMTLATLTDPTMGALVAGNGSAFFDQLVANGCLFPSQFDMAGVNYPWTPLSPTIYKTPDPSYWTALSAFNINWLLRRDIDRASNDNTPMFLSNAA